MINENILWMPCAIFGFLLIIIMVIKAGIIEDYKELYKEFINTYKTKQGDKNGRKN